MQQNQDLKAPVHIYHRITAFEFQAFYTKKLLCAALMATQRIWEAECAARTCVRAAETPPGCRVHI